MAIQETNSIFGKTIQSCKTIPATTSNDCGSLTVDMTNNYILHKTT